MYIKQILRVKHRTKEQISMNNEKKKFFFDHKKSLKNKNFEKKIFSLVRVRARVSLIAYKNRTVTF